MSSIHVAIIMDGNGRWAEKQGRSRYEGHEAGVAAVRRTIKAARELGIQRLTLFAFSAQNWRRTEAEIMHLMALVAEYARRESSALANSGVCVEVIGNLEQLPWGVRYALDSLCQATQRNADLHVTLALSYGGREELVAAARRLAQAAVHDNLDPMRIDETLFQLALWSGELPPVDLLIRTSGEQRLSNFMLWHVAYAELIFLDRAWPDFDANDLQAALEVFAKRQRRFGVVPS